MYINSQIEIICYHCCLQKVRYSPFWLNNCSLLKVDKTPYRSNCWQLHNKNSPVVSLSIHGHVVPVHWPPHLLRPLYTPFLLLSSPDLGRSDVWKQIRLQNRAKHQIRAHQLCIILCVTLPSVLVPHSFYPFSGQCAHMVSALHTFYSFSMIVGYHAFAFLSVFWLTGMCACITSSHGLSCWKLFVVMLAFEETTWILKLRLLLMWSSIVRLFYLLFGLSWI